ncbi:Copine-8 [Armadillidium vulgare]|nr:Copine-8 [Armadillidium vulgare]
MQNSFAPTHYESPVTKVELSVSAINLRDKDVMSKSDPLCVLYIKEQGQNSYFEIGRTELISNCLNPQWVKKFEVDYRFEERQLLRFHVFDWDTKSSNTQDQDSLGYVDCSLGEVMSCQGSQYKKPLSIGGTLIISGEEVAGSNEIVTLNVSANNLDKKKIFGKSNPFLVISRSLQDNAFTAVHKTEVIKKNLNPNWKPIIIPARSLCGGDENRPIKFECFHWKANGSHSLIGVFQTNFKTLKEGSGSQNVYTFINPKKQKKSGYVGSGKLILNSCSMHVEPTFLEYIKGGLQLHFTVAVDFTASNGDPQRPNSLHYRQQECDNQYSLAIKSVGEIIQDYDTDKMFPALGFGAQIPPDMLVSHEFFLNGSPDNPYCQGLEGVLNAYNHSLHNVRLYGPTNFSPVIRHVSRFAQAFEDGSSYFILLIITDGIITDLNETKKTLVEVSRLPLSIIIVGVGNEDFSAMELLDEFRRHMSGGSSCNSKTLLAKDVLAEVPSQVTSHHRCLVIASLIVLWRF